MDIRPTVKTWLLLSVYCLIYFHGAKSDSGQRPNIVFILADDLGFNDVPWNNPHLVAPNIKSLAAKSTIIHNYYTYYACNPSRASLMTGYYHLNTHMLGLNTLRATGLRTQHSLMPQYFKNIGYKTHLLGKWHLGFCKRDYLPTRRGFDTFYGFYDGAEDYFTHRTSSYHGPDDTYDLYDFFDGEKPDFTANGTYSTTLFARRAKQIIVDHAKQKDPFLLVFSSQNIHGPLQAPSRAQDPYHNMPEGIRKTALYMILELDDAVGEILKTLHEKGLEDNTIIVFTSDNGGSPCLGGNNHPLRGEKKTIWEGGIRVPALIHLPNVEERTVKYQGLFHVADWLPTLYEAAGGSETDFKVDGISQLKALQTDSAHPRDEVFHISHHGRGILRKGPHKIIVQTHRAGYWVTPDEQQHYHFGEDTCPFRAHIDATIKPEIQVFNLEDDPGETTLIHNKTLTAELMKRVGELQDLIVEAEARDGMPEQKPENSGFLLNKRVLQTGWC